MFLKCEYVCWILYQETFLKYVKISSLDRLRFRLSRVSKIFPCSCLKRKIFFIFRKSFYQQKSFISVARWQAIRYWWQQWIKSLIGEVVELTQYNIILYIIYIILQILHMNISTIYNIFMWVRLASARFIPVFESGKTLRVNLWVTNEQTESES